MQDNSQHVTNEQSLVTSDAKSDSNSVSNWDDVLLQVPDLARDYLEERSLGKSQDTAMSNVGVTSSQLHQFRQNAGFRALEARLATARHSLGEYYAKRRALAVAPLIVSQLVDDATSPKNHARERISAGVAVLNVGGIGKSGSSINVSVNVGQSAKAYLSSQDDAK